MRNAEIDKQLLAAKKVIGIAKEHNILIKDVSIYVRTFRRRWYDSDESICKAMEYLKAAPLEIQKEIAIEIINFLCELDN